MVPDLTPGYPSAARFFVIAGNDTRVEVGVRSAPGIYILHLFGRL